MNAAIGDNKFLRVLIAAKRAKQIRKGANPLVQSSSMRATRIALEEVEQGLISFEFAPEEGDLRIGRGDQADGGRSARGEGNRELTNQLLAVRNGD